MAQAVVMLQRKNGPTLAETMEKMGWQRHTVRGFMAGAMKKAGFTVGSFKPEGGEAYSNPRMILKGEIVSNTE
jgi:predicted transcriptional regulator